MHSIGLVGAYFCVLQNVILFSLSWGKLASLPAVLCPAFYTSMSGISLRDLPGFLFCVLEAACLWIERFGLVIAKGRIGRRTSVLKED